MPIYEYEHEGDGCAWGKTFECRQSIKDEAHRVCPHCGAPVRKLLPSRIGIATPRSDRELKDQGFTKLVRRDKGVYENVTAREGEKRIVTEKDLGS